MPTDLPTGTSVNLEPNYERVFGRFYSVLDAESDQLVRQMNRACQPRTAAELHRGVTFLQLYENAQDTFKALHDWLGPFAVAFQAATTMEQVAQLRDHVADLLKKVDTTRRENEV